jgi:hypothetical protein
MRAFWKFICAVIKEWQGWLGGSLPMVALAVIGMATPIAVPLWAWGLLVFVAGLTVANFRVYLGLEEAKNSARTAVSHLKERLTPKLACSFDEDIDGCVRSAPFGFSVNIPPQWDRATGAIAPGRVEQRAIDATWWRIKVENLGIEPLRHCTGRLISITREGEFKPAFAGEILNLPFAPGGAPDAFAKEIRHDREEYLDFLLITADDKPHVSSRTLPGSFDWNKMFENPGVYVLEINISSSETRSEKIKIGFHWRGKRATAHCFVSR